MKVYVIVQNTQDESFVCSTGHLTLDEAKQACIEELSAKFDELQSADLIDETAMSSIMWDAVDATNPVISGLTSVTCSDDETNYVEWQFLINEVNVV